MTFIGYLRELFALVKPSRRLFTLLGMLTALGELIALPGVFLFAWLITLLQKGGEPTTLRNNLLLYAGLIITLYLAQAGISIVRVGLNRRFSLTVANTLRKQYFAKLLSLPYAHFLEQHAGGQANSFLNDIDEIDLSITGLMEVGLRSICLLFFYGLALLIWNPLVGLVALIVMPLIVFLQRRLRRRTASRSLERVRIRETMLSKISEAIANIPVVKSFTMEAQIQTEIGELSGRYRRVDTSLSTQRGTLRSMAAIMLAFTQFAFFTAGAWLVMDGRLKIGPFLGQMLILSQFTTPLNSLLDYYNQLTQSNSALHRVRETLALPNEGAEHSREVNTLVTTDSGGIALTLRKMSFQYAPQIPVLRDWDLNVAPGETVAIVGASGAGKTTLFHLLLGFFTDFSGEIKINGLDIRTLALTALRSQIGVVFQEHILFNASLRDNLLIGVATGEAVSDDRLWAVLEMAHAREFVEDLPAGLSTFVGVNGIKLSGGQRQRLALARVILKNPPLLLLDEATSALDSMSEQHIQVALRELFQERTSLVIAHRLSTITEADQIIVIDQGRICERGTHAELVKKDGVYRKLYDAQVKGFLAWDSLAEGREND